VRRGHDVGLADVSRKETKKPTITINQKGGGSKIFVDLIRAV
jgi:hypothetical protein